MQALKQSEAGQPGLPVCEVAKAAAFQVRGNAWRACTVATRTEAVERVILAMRERLGYSFTLQEMADIAIMSPYHFNRVFHDVVGIPPRLFQGALRLEAAKRLLLTTSLKVIDICYAVGYDSLGTFTTRFTDFVGLPPTSLRRIAERHDFSAFAASEVKDPAEARPDLPEMGLRGRLNTPENFDGLVYVGLFQLPISQTRPVGCDVLTSTGEYFIPTVPDGQYYVMAAALARNRDPLSCLLTENVLRGRVGPVYVRNGMFTGPADVTLREASLTDPPIIIALPFLLNKKLEAANRVAV